MSETFLDGRVTIRVGDVQSELDALEENSFDCSVVSPPYWGLRSYLPDDSPDKHLELGCEPTLGEHIAAMVKVFEKVRRVLKPTGSLWLNYGDCYATTPSGRSASDTKAAGNDDRTFRDKPFSTIGPIYPAIAGDPFRRDMGRRGGGMNSDPMLKNKDLCMVPNRIAIALQEAGWWVRAEIVWGKTNPMPDSSGRYRPGSAHEKIFMLSKTGSPFYNSEAVAVGRVQNENSNGYPGSKGDLVRKRDTVGNVRVDKQRGHSRPHVGFNNRWDLMTKEEQMANGRLLRNYEPAPLEVWRMATHPFSEAHFATFPPELAERCITAGCPEGGSVLDPFGGSGTTALVAATLGRTATLIELNPEYATLARARIEAAFMGKEEGARHMVRKLGKTEAPGPLFADVK